MPLIGWVRDSALFAVRRISRNTGVKTSFGPVKAVVVDLDGLLYDGNHMARLNEVTSGNHGIVQSEAKKFLSGKTTPNDAMYAILQNAIQSGLNEMHVTQAALYFERKTNPAIVNALVRAQNNGIKVIFATRGFKLFGEKLADVLAEKHGLIVDHVVGAEHESEGKRITGVSKIIGLSGGNFRLNLGGKQKTIPVSTKWAEVKRLGFDLSKTVMLTNDLLDSGDLKQTKVGVMISQGRHSKDHSESIGAVMGLNDVFWHKHDPDLEERLVHLFENSSLKRRKK